MNVLKPGLSEKISMAKEDCLTSASIPFVGITHELKQDNEHTTIYSLLPSLENAQVVETEDINGKKAYLIKGAFTANISNESVQILLEQILIANNLLESGKFEELNELKIMPPEMEMTYKALDNLTKGIWLKGRIDDLYSNFAHLIARLRNIQRQYIEQESMKKAPQR